MLDFLIKTVPFSKLRHNDLPCYVAEGYGGRRIEAWPVYTFFKTHLQGNQPEAKKAYAIWYLKQLQKYSHVPKREGGMKHGSLYKLIELEGGQPFDSVSLNTKQQLIKKRVNQRLALLEDIKDMGYDFNTEQIEGVQKDGLVYLRGGHHRAAALRALGRNELPNVRVIPNRFIEILVTILRTIRYAIQR